MRVIKKGFILALLISVYSINLSAQSAVNGWDLSFLIGVNLGATTPVPVPKAVDITGYHPKFNPKIGADLTYWFSEHWGAGAGLSIDWKGMNVRTRVDEVHLTIDVPNLGTLSGNVTGRNKTRVNTLYLTQPVYATYRFNDCWRVKAGIYMAEALARKFKGEVKNVEIVVQTPIEQQREIPYATLDYGEHARKFDVGLLVGAEYRMNRPVGFFADFNWGFTPYFSSNVPIHFTMRNVYFAVGATFHLKSLY